MKGKKLGIELANLIADTVGESIDNLAKTLGTQEILLEYVALLLWIVSMEADMVLTKKSIQTIVDAAFHGTFAFLEGAATRTGITYFNAKMFQDFIHNRFEMYYDIWRDTGDHGMIAYNFVVCCFGDDAEYRRLVPNPEDRASQMIWVVNQWTRFSMRARFILSSF